MLQAIDQSPELTPLERRVLDVALGDADPALEPLRRQAAAATVRLRTPSGVGFMTRLQVPGDLAGMPAAAGISLPPVRAEHPGLSQGAEFLVEVRGGFLTCIEAFCFEGFWPADESQFSIGPTSGQR